MASLHINSHDHMQRVQKHAPCSGGSAVPLVPFYCLLLRANGDCSSQAALDTCWGDLGKFSGQWNVSRNNRSHLQGTPLQNILSQSSVPLPPRRQACRWAEPGSLSPWVEAGLHPHTLDLAEISFRYVEVLRLGCVLGGVIFLLQHSLIIYYPE